MKRSETVGNSRKHDQAKTCPTPIFLISISAQRSFFLKVQRSPKGNGWKQSEIAPSLRSAKTMFLHHFQIFFMNYTLLHNNYFFAERRCDLRLFPTVSPWTPLDLEKKTALRGNVYFKKKCGLDKFWPDHVSDCFRPFPTVSFFWTIIWANSIH